MRGAGSKLCLLTGTDMEGPKARPTPRDASRDTGSPGLRAPVKGESSSSDLHLVSDGDTPVDPSKIAPDPEATLVDVDATVGDRTLSPSPPQRMASGLFASAAVLRPGDVLGGRYEILQLLGEGGMGAVYKARDRELNRFVALKVIRPQLAASPAILARFKQELLLAHQVTHKNVIRIYDLAEADGVKFITMEFIEGVDLRHLLLEHGKLPPAEAVEVIRQVCLALDAAHSVGVIHRDLKPQNIMQDKQGRILVMDFGLARSVESEGMTQTGALVGTMEYMSPEQALGNELDQRSDLFALGLIFFELLTGKVPYKAETALASLLKRNQERAISAVELDLSIPKGVSDIVAKCLERNLDQRYQNGQEILNDLDAWQGKRPISASSQTAARRVAALPWKWIGAAALAIVVAAGGWELRLKIGSKGATTHGPVTSLAILPFRNASGDPNLDWLGPSMAEMLTTDVGQSQQLHTVPPERVQQILRDLRLLPEINLDEPTLRRLAEFSSADQLVWGQYARFGDRIRIDATLRDLKHQRSIPLKIDAISEKDVPSAVDQMARLIQENLSVSSSVVQELRAAAFKPSSNSVQALRYYNEGLQLARQGKHLEAVKQFHASTKEDPAFALAYAKLGQTYANLGYDNDADESSQRAVELSEKLPPPEKYRIIAIHARIVNDNRKAIEAYENLAKLSPDDPDVQFNLAQLYQATSAFDRAREQYSRLLAVDPKYVDALLGLGRVEMSSGNPQKGLEFLNRGLSLSIELGNDEEKAAMLHAIGSAYNRLNKPDDALRNLQQALEIRQRLGDQRGISATLNSIGYVYEGIGKWERALKNYNDSLQKARAIGDKRDVGMTLINLGNMYHTRGQTESALKAYKESLQIQHDTGDPALEALCLNNIGVAYSERGEYQDALTYFQQALQLREGLNISADISETAHNLAENYSKLGQYDQAVNYYLRALHLSRNAGDKLGAAMESYSMGTVFKYQGRYGGALSANEDAMKTVREQGQRDYSSFEIMNSYGNALSLVGRNEDAQKVLDEGLKVAREAQSASMIAEALNFQGELAFYRGDYKSAQTLFEQSLKSALRSGDPFMVLLVKTNLAKTAVRQGRFPAAIAALKGLMRDADSRGLKYLSAQSSLYLGDALLSNKDSRAREELESAVRKSDRLGAKVLLLQSHYLVAKALRSAGQAEEAARHEAEAVRMLGEVRKESGTDTLLKRSDLAPIFPKPS
jgi:tetratricopeptide (TPR) repeat protein